MMDPLFPLRGKRCSIEAITLEGVELPKVLDAESCRKAFRSGLLKNLREFGLELAPPGTEAEIRVTVQITKTQKIWEDELKLVFFTNGIEYGIWRIFAKANIVAEGTAFEVYAAGEGEYSDEQFYISFITQAAEKLFYRIHEALIDYYLYKVIPTAALPGPPLLAASGDPGEPGVAEKSLTRWKWAYLAYLPIWFAGALILYWICRLLWQIRYARP